MPHGHVQVKIGALNSKIAMLMSKTRQIFSICSQVKFDQNDQFSRNKSPGVNEVFTKVWKMQVNLLITTIWWMKQYLQKWKLKYQNLTAMKLMQQHVDFICTRQYFLCSVRLFTMLHIYNATCIAIWTMLV